MYSTGTEKLTFPSRIRRTKITYPEVYLTNMDWSETTIALHTELQNAAKSWVKFHPSGSEAYHERPKKNTELKVITEEF